ncbi:MAG: superoxide dismutase [Candidatus Portnoybacteria bacterium CG10_big_fil_rev_8_21_14_0_10_36_7]|uniref:superoxide dismutase n=1 Tax=Candidatus Portnoybacteria bacterium CG10_big_fil_rev_8_21_14_0_10_36_7 TaxID=1974812 RepID=A0A2M8KDZ5_9BACT|nr:MAG: superoxide dismutase [Candidatus Portnoybacteria bacterium CG10_big_fil_rev_8_21_14_0_10_36_7]
MPYQEKNFNNLIGVHGLSDNLLNNHLTLYQGYVTNFNKLNDTLVNLERDDKFASPEYAELNRRFGWEFNGMRLHELYFANMTKSPVALDCVSGLAKAIDKEFGSYNNFEKDFKSMCAMRGIGWIILYYDKAEERFFNVWINEYDAGHFTGCVPLLVMDVFEHAYILDYSIKKAGYIDAFIKVIDWSVISNRFE